jgi:hypothetical protein
MTTIQRDQLAAAVESYAFSARGHDWSACVCATHEIQGEPFLHLALLGDPLLMLTLRVPDNCDTRTAAARIADAVVSWLADAKWPDDGSIGLASPEQHQLDCGPERVSSS